jgi:hypothetical protein
MQIPKIVLLGMFCLPVDGYSQLPQLKIMDSDLFKNHIELKNLDINETVDFSFKGSLMSTRIKNATLGSVLQEFSRVTGVAIYLSEYRAQESVSVAFENLPLKRALQRILGDNYTLAFKGLPGKQVSISDLSNIRLIHGVEVAAIIGSSKTLHYGLDGLIEQTLKGNENERILALKSLKVNGGKIDTDLLRRLASDSSATIRQLALKEAQDSLDDKAAIALLQTAVNTDSDPTVRAYAETALENFGDQTSSSTATDPTESETFVENSKVQETEQPQAENKNETPSEPVDLQNTPLELAELDLQNSDDQVRTEALESIRKNNLKVDLDLLLAATSDSNPENRKLALDAIARRLHPVEANEILAQRIEIETDPGVKQHAEYTLNSVKRSAEWVYKIKL